MFENLKNVEHFDFFFFFFSKFSAILMNDEENVNATSSEILQDVLKQLDKLGTEKRNQILKKLKSSVANKNDEEEIDQQVSSTSEKLQSSIVSKKTSNLESVQDEVEMLDLNEPKMGTYKRKRSE